MSFYGMGNESAMIEDAIEAGGMAWWVMEIPSGVVFCSPNKLLMLGYTEKDARRFAHYTAFTNLVHPDDYDNCMDSMNNLLIGKADMYETQYRIRAADGSYVTLYDRGRIVGKKQSGEVAIAGIVLDITHHPLLINVLKKDRTKPKIDKKTSTLTK